MAGQASIKCRKYMQDGKNPLLQPWKGVRSEDLIVDALLGITLFKASFAAARALAAGVMGGRFRSVMPSDLANVGAIARESLPAPSVEYATEANRVELRRLFTRDGCHHCGTRRGAVIGDHMPPNKQVQQYVHTARRSLLNLPFVKQLASAMNIPTAPPRQRFYPQCTSCSQKQSAAIRNNKLTLVFHEVLHHGGKSQAWHFAGAFLGMRHYHGSDGGRNGSKGKNGGARGMRRS
ncbi:hypothetical protein CHLNCDRAFT_141732 [Chlorella variabilis]|uniref:Uncharacterized protein n=1 Tax=Chlorella variabilis TaxID=554065 RepID=E1ZTH3_CHLVA|nr:hypothetical protein CHLNCDRAFT_141732 [Chlorella variabilis]EFN50931.1 hypothetical protein CHLNCDRAFT_141732 [Chlorella variabilis]|eukprot:XP_005843033.1 hypothetical protein CHLNCDRAFT_141732 [Chlorella variabilis]